MKQVLLFAIIAGMLTAAPQSPMSRLKSALSLSDEQEKKITAIMNDGRIKAEKKMIELDRERLNMREEMIKDAPDAGRVKAILDKKASIESELAFIKVKGEIDMKAILSKDQFAAWRGMRHRMEMMKKHGEPPMMHRPEAGKPR